MKLEYSGRWIRLRLEVFPAEFKQGRVGSMAQTLALRRQLLRQLNHRFQQDPAWWERS
jgi:hypothetical protein